MWRLVTSIMIAGERRRRSIYKAKCCWRLSAYGLLLRLLQGQLHKDNSDGKRVGRRTIQKQDRSIWRLWEESHGQFSVVHKMWKLGS